MSNFRSIKNKQDCKTVRNLWSVPLSDKTKLSSKTNCKSRNIRLIFSVISHFRLAHRQFTAPENFSSKCQWKAIQQTRRTNCRCTSTTFNKIFHLVVNSISYEWNSYYFDIYRDRWICLRNVVLSRLKLIYKVFYILSLAPSAQAYTVWKHFYELTSRHNENRNFEISQTNQ